MKTIYKINNIKIKIEILNENPYIKIKFYGDCVTNIKKELIYRIYLEQYAHLSKTINIDSLTELLIKNVLLEKYDKVYKMAIRFGYCIIMSYLVSKSLVKIDSFKNSSAKFSICHGSDAYKKYYLSFLDANTLEKRPDIFPIKEFSEYIKYSDSFIDSHFSDFVYSFYNYNKKKECFLFCAAELQQPSFNTLLKHIGEFDIDNIAPKLSLNEKRINELKLLEKILIH